MWSASSCTSGEQFGWCVGKIVSRNLDTKQYKNIDGQRIKVNFIIYYELDQDTVKTVLQLSAYGGDDVGSWMLLGAEVTAMS